MNAGYILYGLLLAFGTPPVAPDVARGERGAVKILISGPAQARNQMAAAIRPLLGANPDIRSLGEDGISPDLGFPARGGPAGDASEIWIDVSNPARLRVYLPAADQGTTTIRTLSRADAERAGADSVALEEAAQIVKAAVLSLGREPTAATEPSPGLADGGAIISKQPAAPSGGSAASRAHSHDGLFVRSQVGYGYIKASQADRSGCCDHLVPTVGLAVGASLPRGIILYGELGMSGIPNSSEASGDTPNRDLVLYRVGPGVAYYLESPNLYVSGTLSLAKIAFSGPTPAYGLPDPDLGYAATFTAGKEWWVGPSWALGLAGQYTLGRMNEYWGASTHMTVTSFSLLFSATYD